MGTISVNKLGGLSLIVGPVLAVICFLVRPGGGLVGGNVDPANAEASIGVLLANADLAGISHFLAPIGLILFLYGLNALVGTLKDGNGEALARYGTLFVLFALVGWLISSALALTIAGGNAGAAVGALYVTSLGINISASILGALGFLAISLAISTRDDFNKPFALVVAAVSALLLVTSIMSGRDLSFLQTANMISGFGYTVSVVWGVTLGLALLKKG